MKLTPAVIEIVVADMAAALAFYRRLGLDIPESADSEPHVDVPFHHDHEIGVVEHLFGDDPDVLVEEFAAELDSARFDVRRLRLAA